MHDSDCSDSSFADLAALCDMHRLLGRLEQAESPRLEFVWPSANPSIRRLGVLAGSFNPLTLAHTSLADAALRNANLDLVSFALSSRTVDKERPTGMILEDRLLTLRIYANAHPGTGVLALNRGLYVDQAMLLRRALPSVEFLGFVIGFDKLVQIFDPRYYADRDQALDHLFEHTTLLVAPRAGAGAAEIEALLSRPENHRYQRFVQFLPVPRGLCEISATGVRALVAAGRDPDGLVPPIVADLIAQTGVYRSPMPIDGESIDVYGLRRQLVESLCSLPAVPAVDLSGVLATAQSGTRTGRSVRQAIETLPPSALASFLRNLAG